MIKIDALNQLLEFGIFRESPGQRHGIVSGELGQVHFLVRPGRHDRILLLYGHIADDGFTVFLPDEQLVVSDVLPARCLGIVLAQSRADG